MILTKPRTTTVQELLDKSQIKELIEFERFCRDNALWAEMKSCFASGSRVDISWFQGTGEGFVDASSQFRFRAPHKLYNSVIWVNGDRAFALTLATIDMPLPSPDHPANLLADAKLVYRLERRDGQWLIVRFEGIYEKDSIVPAFPQRDFQIDPRDLAPYRESYAGMAYFQTLQGRPVRDDLVGIDRPEMVANLYSDAENWLTKQGELSSCAR